MRHPVLAFRLVSLPASAAATDISEEKAIEFVNAVAEVAEDADQHPDIYVHGWNKVKLSLMTPAAGGVTEADVAMALKLDRI